MGYGGDNVGVVEAWSIIQNTCQNYFEPDLSKSLCSGTRYVSCAAGLICSAFRIETGGNASPREHIGSVHSVAVLSG